MFRISPFSSALAEKGRADTAITAANVVDKIFFIVIIPFLLSLDLKNHSRRPLLHQLNLPKKTKAKRYFIKEEKRWNAFAFQIFLTQRNFLFVKYLTAGFSWWSNNTC
jgi:hypothetical protein